MDMTLAASAAMMSATQTQNLMQVAMLRSQHQAEASIVDMLTEAVATQAPPPAGQGQLVDKLA